MVLKPCPFCGNATISKNSLEPVKLIEENSTPYGIQRKSFKVKCYHCFASGGSGVSGYNALTGTTTTEEEARLIAIAKWNERT